MALIHKKDIEKLLNVQNNTQNALCISIFIPTHRAGHETLNGHMILSFRAIESFCPARTRRLDHDHRPHAGGRVAIQLRRKQIDEASQEVAGTELKNHPAVLGLSLKVSRLASRS